MPSKDVLVGTARKIDTSSSNRRFEDHFDRDLRKWIILMGDAQIEDGLLHIERPASHDTWSYLYPVVGDRWRDYIFEIGFNRLTTFRELALNFRHIDYNNRYRFRFESDNRLYFDKKFKGKWCNDLKHTRFKIKNGKWYQVSIKCIGRDFSCSVDERIILKAQDDDIKRGRVAIICWDDMMNPIRARFDRVRIELFNFAPLEG